MTGWGCKNRVIGTSGHLVIGRDHGGRRCHTSRRWSGEHAEVYANRYPDASNPRQSGMDWDDHRSSLRQLGM